jgi:hypothetical protein
LGGPLSLGRRELLSWLRENWTSLATTKRAKREIKASEGLSRPMESMLSVEARTGPMDRYDSVDVLEHYFCSSNEICLRPSHHLYNCFH